MPRNAESPAARKPAHELLGLSLIALVAHQTRATAMQQLARVETSSAYGCVDWFQYCKRAESNAPQQP